MKKRANLPLTENTNTSEILETSYRLVVENSGDLITLLDPKASILYTSPSYKKLLDYEPQELIGRDAFAMVHPEDHKLLRKELQNLLSGQIGRAVFRYRHKNGQYIFVDGIANPIRDKNGRLSMIVSTLHDITERRRNEENLRFLSEASKILSGSLDYKTTLRNIAHLAVPKMADWCSIELKTDKGIEQLALVNLDPKKVAWTKLQQFNPLRLDAESVISRVLNSGKSELYPNITDELLVKTFKKNNILSLVRTLHLTSIMIVPMIFQKETIGVISFISAESGQHYTSADIAIAEEIASRAALAIKHTRLYAHEQTAVNVRDEFISVASHELKTPVTSLKLYAQLLQKEIEKKNDTSLNMYFVKMEDQINKLTTLVNDLLHVSKLQHGRLEYAMEEVDLNQIVNDTVEITQSTTTHEIIILGRIHTNVYADKYRICQVLTNLLTNAIKYSPKAKRVIVTLIPKTEYAEVEVKDFGIGIEKTQQKKIFNQFYRVNNDKALVYPGLGMGLYIANEIIKRHQGTMHVHSTKGKGSKFSFSLPYNKQK